MSISQLSREAQAILRNYTWNTLCIFIARSIRGNVTSLTMGIWGFMIPAGTAKKIEHIVSTHSQILLPLSWDSNVDIFKSCHSPFLNIIWISGGNYFFTGSIVKDVPSKFKWECVSLWNLMSNFICLVTCRHLNKWC